MVGASVVAVNSWMNTPLGFEIGADGRVADVNVAEVLFNPAFGHEFPHMWLAAYKVTGFPLASGYAVGVLRRVLGLATKEPRYVTSLSSATNPSVYGQPVTISAQVSVGLSR